MLLNKSGQIVAFNMPLKVKLDSKEQWIKPTNTWTNKYTKETAKELIIDANFYVGSLGI